MMSLLLRLLIAHLLGDFVFQTKAMVDEKELKKMRSPLLYVHVFIHFVCIMVLVWDVHFLWAAIIISIVHFFIDVFKAYMGRGKLWFFIDQLLHILTIALVWSFYAHPVLSLPYFNEDNFLVVVASLLFVTRPAGIIIKIIITRWEANHNPGVPSPLHDAGLYIGIMERLLVVVVILLNQWAVVGLLLVAKSIFRSGGLRHADDHKHSDYTLIGTLLSFSIAIATGIIANYLLGY